MDPRRAPAKRHVNPSNGFCTTVTDDRETTDDRPRNGVMGIIYVKQSGVYFLNVFRNRTQIYVYCLRPEHYAKHVRYLNAF